MQKKPVTLCYSAQLPATGTATRIALSSGPQWLPMNLARMVLEVQRDNQAVCGAGVAYV